MSNYLNYFSAFLVIYSWVSAAVAKEKKLVRAKKKHISDAFFGIWIKFKWQQKLLLQKFIQKWSRLQNEFMKTMYNCLIGVAQSIFFVVSNSLCKHCHFKLGEQVPFTEKSYLEL